MKMTTFRKAGMRAAMVALCSCTLCAAPMMAQDQAPASPQGPPREGGGPRGGRSQVEMLTKRLNLTTDQQAQVKAIDEDTGKQMMALRNDTSLSQDERRSKMMEIRKGSQDKIRAILTDEQKTKYDAMQAEMRERMKERQQQGGAPPPPPQ
jgi:periplasmic protein CpxP/Spy